MKKVSKAYPILFIYVLLIFTAIPFARSFQKAVYQNLGKEYFGYFVLVSIVVISICIVRYLRRLRPKEITVSNYIWLLVISGIYIFYIIKLWKCPEEAMHLLTYGLLSYLLYKALSFHVKDKTIYFSIVFIVLSIGTFDEIIQWIVPERHWNFKDVGLNLLAGILFQIGLWKGIKPGNISERIQYRSILILYSTSTISVILLVLCALNTESNQQNFIKNYPAFSFLENYSKMMNEYGYKNNDSEIGMFYSKFKMGQLKIIDNKYKSNYSKILNEFYPKDYSQFIKLYTTIDNPYLHEMRVRIFRRDRYLKLAENEGCTATSRMDSLIIAYKENLILLKYFGVTLKMTKYFLNDNIFNEVQKNESDRFYESPVNSELFTIFSEKELKNFFICFIIVQFISILFFRKHIYKK